MISLTALAYCAAMLTGLPMPDTMPAYQDRLPVAADWKDHPPASVIPPGYRVVGVYQSWLNQIVAPSDNWSVLVHEMVHYLQDMAGLPYGPLMENQAYAAQARAHECVEVQQEELP
jgi:hypothetical protein